MIYLDYHATTPMDPRVLEAMLPYFTEHFGNAASRNHPYGWAAEQGVEKAREQIALLIGALDDRGHASGKEIVLTSGATESINLALKGVAEMYAEKGKHLITTKVEHKATLDTCAHLERLGYEVTYLDVDRFGLIDLAALEAAIRPDTILVSILHANNEIGTVQDLSAIGEITRSKGVLLHVDAAQSAGKVPVDVKAMKVDLLSLSGHKLYGPKGVGALYVRRKGPRVRLSAQTHGGGHERGMRSGTLNVPGIVGLGKACEIARLEMADEGLRLASLRDKLYRAITEAIDHVHLNGHPTQRLPGNLNLSFEFVEGESLMMGMKGIAVSSGSACTSASLEPSHVLKAIGVSSDLAHTSLRFGLGRFTTEAEIDETASIVIAQVQRLRELSPLYEMYKDGIDLKQVQWQAH
ncbi:IscS subfamily cysteine desulfurase [bacterium]|nr:IscS subfamily cysteine desulfurase [bacterium]